MYKPISRAAIAAVIAFFISSAGIGTASAQNQIGEILNRMDVHNKSIQSIRANVTMVKYDAVLKHPDTLNGTTSYLPKYNGKRYMRLDWLRPQEHIVVVGDNYELWKPSINVVYTGKTNKAKNSAAAGGALSFMSMSKAQLKANYDLVFIGEESLSDGTRTVRLQLTPKTPQDYKMADLWVDSDGMPRQAKILERNNDTTTVLLTGIRKNERIDAALFALKYPKNVTKRSV